MSADKIARGYDGSHNSLHMAGHAMGILPLGGLIIYPDRLFIHVDTDLADIQAEELHFRRRQ